MTDVAEVIPLERLAIQGRQRNCSHKSFTKQYCLQNSRRYVGHSICAFARQNPLNDRRPRRGQLAGLGEILISLRTGPE